MPVTFQQPVYLLLLVLVLPAAWIGVRWFSTMSRARAWSAIIARSILLALLTAILAGAAGIRSRDRVAVVVVVDVSQSVRQLADEFTDFGTDAQGKRRRWNEAVRDWLTRAEVGRKPDDLMGMVVFDGATIASAAPSSEPLSDYSMDWTMSDGTDIGAALRLAEAMFPPGAARRIVLISDGAETAGSATEAADRLAAGAGGVTRVDVVPLSYHAHNEVMIEAVDAPPLASMGQRVSVRVVLSATEPTTGSLDLLYAGKPVDLNGSAPGTSQPVSLKPGRNPIVLEVELNPTDNVHTFEPIFTPSSPSADRLVANNRAEITTISPGKGKVLIVDGWGQLTNSPLARTLKANNIETEVRSPAGLPTDLLQISSYSCIILDNVPSEELPRHTHDLLADYVESLGGGLVMVGGRDSLTAGGWKGTSIERILPVSLDLPEDVVLPSAAVAFIIDASGSMGSPVQGSNKSQQQIADEAAAMAIASLDKNDLVEVIAFDHAYNVVVPLQRNDNPQRLSRIVRGISPNGGTEMYTPLKKAGADLAGAEASVRHAILMTDGQSEGSASDGINTAAKMNAAGITVSTIAIGDGADVGTLAAIAKAGGGKFYQVIDPNQLPKMLIKEVRVVRKPEVREAPFIPVDQHSGSPVIDGISSPFLPLAGLVLTQPKADPKVFNVLATPEGEPVLAHWFVGRGQAAAFTSDAHAWAAEWIKGAAWGGYGRMWTQLVRTVSRPPMGRDYDLTTDISGDDMVVRMEAFDEDGKPIDNLTVPARVYAPDQTSVDVTLEQVGPGVYEARSPAPLQGSYVVSIIPRQGAKPMPPVVGSATRQIGAEFRRMTSDVELLQRIAEITGGRLLDIKNPDEARLFDRQGLAPARASTPLWPWLLAWSLAFFVLDVGTRRVAWDRLVNRAMAVEFAEHAAAAVKARGEGAVRTIGRLKHRADQVGAVQARPVDELAPGPGAPQPRASGPMASEKRSPRARPEPKVASPEPEAETPPEGEEGTTAGLLAAKRRVRARMDDASREGPEAG